METKYIKGAEARQLIKETFTELRELVVPTMGARGRMAILDDPMGQPQITDDGVTVMRMLRKFKGFKFVVAKSALEAAHNTEREARDGTTLTLLLLDEIYKHGYDLIEQGVHPQEVANQIQHEMTAISNAIDVMEMKPDMVKDIATIATKVPEFGDIIAQAHAKAGDKMDLIVEHKPGERSSKIEHSDGFTLFSGYTTPAFKGQGSDFENAKAVILKQNSMTEYGFTQFINSIPKDEVGKPLIFFVTPNFNPEVMRLFIETLTPAGIPYQFIFINEPQPDDVFMDIAEVTGGKLQDPTSGIKDYLYEHCGDIKSIHIEINKSILIGINHGSKRVPYYNRKLTDKKYQLSDIEEALVRRRLAGLTKGLTKIVVGTPTLLEFSAVKKKLDDGIGAVRAAFETGAVLGGGKAMYNLRHFFKSYEKILTAPHIQILANAGITDIPNYRVHRNGYNVVTNKKVNLEDDGIIDSAASIKSAIKNATSIATNYLRAYVIIKEEDSQ